MKRCLLVGAVLGIVPLFTGCWFGGKATTEAQVAPRAGSEVHSLYEQRLVRLVEDIEALNQAAEAVKEADYPEIERQFHNVANAFNILIADNPDEIEGRLIYAKLLEQFGDRLGARDECGEVLRRDPTVAVAYQMLGTYFAEEEGDHARALSYYLNAIKYGPEEAVYHFGLGDLLYTFRPGMIEDGIFTPEVLDAKMVEAFRAAAELAPEDLSYQFRYGECFYDLPDPDWAVPLAFWESLTDRSDLTAIQREATLLHRARCLGELARYDEARAMAKEITAEGLTATRDALITAIDEAEARS